MFEMEETSGSLYLLKPLDFDSRIRHRLQIAKTRLPYFNAEPITVILEVLEENNHRPRFAVDPVQFEVLENMHTGSLCLML
jgi:hypothetical protein